MDFVQIMSTFGFPVVACIGMAIYVKDITKTNREDTKALNEQHTKEMLEFKEEIKVALNNNTLALNRLCDKLDGKGGIIYENE